MYKKNELYNKALSNVHRYSLLNEIFAIRDERFKNEQQDTMLCVNGYIGINTLDRYVRNIDELVEYQNIDTIEHLKEKDKEIERLNNIIGELEKYLKENYVIDNPIKFKNDLLDKLKELKEGK